MSKEQKIEEIKAIIRTYRQVPHDSMVRCIYQKMVTECEQPVVKIRRMTDKEILKANSAYEWNTEDDYPLVDAEANLGRWKSISQATVDLVQELNPDKECVEVQDVKTIYLQN